MQKGDAKKYNRIKLTVSLAGIAIDFIFWIVIIFGGLAVFLAEKAESLSSSNLVQFYYFIAALGILNLIINFPLSFYSGYVVEHRFSLSNQSLLQWGWEQIKGMMVGIILGVILLTIFYLLLQHFPNWWWLGLWLFILIFSVLLSRLAPVLIFPLFYKFEPLDQPELKERIYKFANQWNLRITGIFKFNLSKTTKKANAAFTGLGKSKRVILGDTLLNNFEEDEIETVFAHEVGHYVKKHLLKGIVFNSLVSLLGIYLVFQFYNFILESNNFIPSQLEALPYLGLLFFLYGLITGPISNYLSRRFEYQADLFAVETTQLKEAYQKTLKKLSDLNLADEEPHPLVELLFYSHPSINHRIEKITEATS